MVCNGSSCTGMINAMNNSTACLRPNIEHDVINDIHIRLLCSFVKASLEDTSAADAWAGSQQNIMDTIMANRDEGTIVIDAMNSIGNAVGDVKSHDIHMIPFVVPGIVAVANNLCLP